MLYVRWNRIETTFTHRMPCPAATHDTHADAIFYSVALDPLALSPRDRRPRYSHVPCVHGALHLLLFCIAMHLSLSLSSFPSGVCLTIFDG